MKKLIVLGAGITGAAVASMALVSTGTAGAATPDTTGQTLSEARAAISASGGSAVVSTTVGDQKAQSDCIVTRQQVSNVPAPENTSASGVTQVLLSLNCNAAEASATSSGNSAGSPAGMAAAAAAASSSAAAAASATPAPAG